MLINEHRNIFAKIRYRDAQNKLVQCHGITPRVWSKDSVTTCHPKILAIPIVISGAMVVLLDSVAEFANTLMLYVDPVIRPLIVALVMFLIAR